MGALMAIDKSRIEHREGRWAVYVRNGAERAADAAWLCLGGCGDARVAIRLWMPLLRDEGRK